MLRSLPNWQLLYSNADMLRSSEIKHWSRSVGIRLQGGFYMRRKSQETGEKYRCVLRRKRCLKEKIWNKCKKLCKNC